ncbi:cytochrome [Roseivivax halodurans JCM 10272]|uniref:Cytochrome n=1 Tax=Roseivivax halodurans JCM 10272 TaxID=1449350 RepID=X7EF11_9RHOB|nr:cytochrome b/b6 domain-containing protein [Roseivivax halodurans]ETX14679.1 cytochrome [Roseivivax halodurans JCM 10272]
MSARNATDRYGTVAKAFHWTTALGIFLNLAVGVLAAWLPTGSEAEVARKASVFSVHKTLGVAIFAVALLRIVWAVTQPKPAPLHPERRAETLLADTVHWLLYGSLVLVPLSGWIGHAASEGFARILWPLGQSLPLVPKSPRLAETAWALHYVLIWVLVIAIAAHVAGALKHHYVVRDETLRRMLPGETRAGRPGAKHGTVKPAALAVLFWAVAIGLGAGAGLYRQGASAAEGPALEAVASEWQVESGTLAIDVIQMNSEVSGAFADWTADIAFEEPDGMGRAGEVTVRINTGSLSLGSVSEQATNSDYLASEEYPTATFSAEIVKSGDGYLAEGTLALKGEEVPVTLPFTLKLDGNTATMQGRTVLDRRSFGIGQDMDSESQVGFEVAVRVELTATRSSD